MPLYRNIGKNATLAEFADYYLDNAVKGIYAEATYKSYKSKTGKYILPEIGNRQVSQLKKLDVQNLIYALNNETPAISPNTVRIVHSILHKVLDFAVDIELVDKNVSTNAKLPPQVKYVPKIYAKADIKNLLDKSQGSFLNTPINLAVRVGLRRSEILALEWSDFKDGTLIVNKSVSKKAPGRLKTIRSKRVLKVPKALSLFLITQREQQKKLLSKNGVVQTGSTLVVCKEDGSPYNPTFISRKFTEFLALNNLPAIRFHDLRHTYATHAHNNGMPVKHLSKSLGHVSAATTIDNYVHIKDTYLI